jgi:hypothetical protein
VFVLSGAFEGVGVLVSHFDEGLDGALRLLEA